MICRSSECGNEVEDPSFAYCEPCRVLVWACEPVIGEPHYIAPHDPLGHAGLEVELGVEHMLDQCDSCGNCRYVVGQGPVAVCSDMEIDGEHYPGCGSKYPITLRPSHEVIF